MDKKILVIEDDPSTSRLVEYTLRHHGYQLIMTTNGTEGLKKARSEGPDVVILDMMLPDIDGFEICRRLRAETSTANISILMFSARAQETDKDDGLKAGADDYLTKPAPYTEIIARVEKLIAKKNGGVVYPEKSSDSTN